MLDISRKFSVKVDGRGTLNVGPNDHVATGGEGSVFRMPTSAGHPGMALKIWTDPMRASKGRMPEKIKLLASLGSPYVVAPEALVRDDTGRAVGYIMPWVDGWALPLAFTNDWRKLNGFGESETVRFASLMRDVTLLTHAKGAVMGDANELNILGVRGEPRYIDVDPWVFPGFPGDKILPTIHDWHSASFGPGADWFAWAVVTFQLFVGVHPYRGTHPDFKRGDLEGRMRAQASVLSPQVRVSAAARPFSTIPARLLDWYRAVLEHGERSIPPEVLLRVPPMTKAAPVTFTGMGKIKLSLAFHLPAPLIDAVTPDILMVEGGLLLQLPEGRPVGRGMPGSIFTRLTDGSIATARAEASAVKFGILAGLPTKPDDMTDAGVSARTVWSAANRMFAIVNDGLLELGARNIGSRHIMLPGRRWSLNANATTFGDGGALYDALGAKYIVVPQQGTAVAVIRVKELDGLRPITMLARERVAVLSLIDKVGSYHRAVVVLSADLASCTVEITDADDGSLNDAVTAGGVLLHVAADGFLEMSAPLKQSAVVRTDIGQIAQGRLIAGPSGVFFLSGVDAFKITTT